MKQNNSQISLQYLVATTNCEKPLELIKKMNIQNDVLVGNQANSNQVEQWSINDYQCRVYTFQEKGVGLNRNNLLMRTTADFLVIADDDMVFKDNANDIILKWIAKYPKIDLFLFNLDEPATTENLRFKTTSPFRVTKATVNRFGAARIVVRRDAIHKHGIFFNLYFGGGSKRSQGEDTIFLNDCLKKGLKLLAVPEAMAKLVDSRQSSWFQGYTEKYFIDKGYLYTQIYGRLSLIFIIHHAIKHQKRYANTFPFSKIIALMKQGRKEFLT